MKKPPPQPKVYFYDLETADAKNAYNRSRREGAWRRAQNQALAHHLDSEKLTKMVQQWLAEAFMAGFDYGEVN